MKIKYRGYTISDKNTHPYGFEWYFGDGETADGPGSKRCGSAVTLQSAKNHIDDDIDEACDSDFYSPQDFLKLVQLQIAFCRGLADRKNIPRKEDENEKE